MILLRILAAAALIAAFTPVSAQQYPAKPVRIIVPFAPGGGSDFIARFMLEMFPWDKPFGLRTFDMTAEKAAATKPLAMVLAA